MSVALRHLDAREAPLGEPTPKPTSTTGQLEAAATVHAIGDAVDIGVWTCDPGTFTADRTRSTEVCQILSGSATITGEDGTSATVAAGSLLVLPEGWRGTWTIHETVRKTYVVIAASPGTG